MISTTSVHGYTQSQAFSMFQWWFMNNFVFYLSVVCVCLRWFLFFSYYGKLPLFTTVWGICSTFFCFFCFVQPLSKTPRWWQLQIMCRNVIPRGNDPIWWAVFFRHFRCGKTPRSSRLGFCWIFFSDRKFLGKQTGEIQGHQRSQCLQSGKLT